MRHSCFPGLSPAVTPGAGIRSQAANRQRPCANGFLCWQQNRRTPCHPCSHITLCRTALVSNPCNVLPPYNAQQGRERSSQAASGAPSLGVHSWAVLAAGVLACPPCSQIKPYVDLQVTKWTMCSLATVRSTAKSQGHKV